MGVRPLLAVGIKDLPTETYSLNVILASVISWVLGMNIHISSVHYGTFGSLHRLCEQEVLFDTLSCFMHLYMYMWEASHALHLIHHLAPVTQSIL